MNNKTFAVVDLETTGHSPTKGDRIIQIAIVFIKNGVVGEKYVRFVNPGHKIPVFIKQLTSISDEDVADAPYFEEIANEVSALLEGTVFIAHNTDFDLSFLQNEFIRCGVPNFVGKKIDTVEFSKILFPSAPSYRLQEITEELGIPLAAAHRADDDAEATAHLFLASMKKLLTLPEDTLKLLHRRSFRLKTDLSTLFYEALQIVRKTNVASELSSFRGIPYQQVPIQQKNFNGENAYPEKEDDKIALLQTAYPNFEKRESQLRFMDEVWTSLSTHTELIAEVPTGIGKTMAYLLPAVLFSMSSNRPVVISTFTNHLVDKIMDEELKKVKLMVGVDVSATVLKGQNRYISLNKFEELLQIADETYDEAFTIMQILVWLTSTITGDLDELNVSGGGQLFVDRIRKRTSRLKQDELEADYHNRLIESCVNSNVIITNHSMLLSDLNRVKKIFTPIAGLIVDEAHQFIQTANRLSQIVFSYTNWKYVIGQIGSDASGQLLHLIEGMKEQFNVEHEREKEQLDHAYTAFLSAFDNLISKLSAFYPVSQKKNAGNRVSFTLDEMNLDRRDFSIVLDAMNGYINKAQVFTKNLAVHTSNMTRNEQVLVTEWDYWVRELKIKAGEWVEIFLDESSADFTVWAERDNRSIPGSLVVYKQSLDSANIIRSLISGLEMETTGIVWTSGTLSIKGNERFIPRQLGIDEEVPLLKFDAPSGFYDGAEIFIVNDMPDIQQVSQTDYIEAVAHAVIQSVMATGGRLFVLFTSVDMLRKTYELVLESCQLEEYTLFAQGISSGSRMKLLKSFKQFDNSVLFGTNSFWEGVDVPGEALTAVIIVRLPFSSPTEPTFKAIAARMTTEGANPFIDYALPEAIMRLRQGFGRLIRTSVDRGFFIILDRRVETKSYGQHFLESLPDVPIKKVSLEHMVNTLENCYTK